MKCNECCQRHVLQTVCAMQSGDLPIRVTLSKFKSKLLARPLNFPQYNNNTVSYSQKYRTAFLCTMDMLSLINIEKCLNFTRLASAQYNLTQSELDELLERMNQRISRLRETCQGRKSMKQVIQARNQLVVATTGPWLLIVLY